MVQFKRGKKIPGDFYERMAYESRCGLYRVVRAKPVFASMRGGTRFAALVKEDCGYRLASGKKAYSWTPVDFDPRTWNGKCKEYRKRHTAEAAIEKHAKERMGG